jgi:hypothetical protein
MSVDVKNSNPASQPNSRKSEASVYLCLSAWMPYLGKQGDQGIVNSVGETPISNYVSP